jgi:hypothetical protein
MAGKPRQCSSLFLDSGAHTLYTQHVIAKGHAEGYRWYESRAFRKYLDAYAEFLKANAGAFDLYANVDVIFNPELSWKAQKYLEKEHGLSPVPVIHYGTSLTWFDKYLEAGYEILGVGGLGQEATRNAYRQWADKVYHHLGRGNGGRPCVKTHGFAMTSFDLMKRYPWWSVDSASWAKAAGFGAIYVPLVRKGEFSFDRPPEAIAFSHRSGAVKVLGKHYRTTTRTRQAEIDRWLEEIDVPFGVITPDGTIKEDGASSQYALRALANARYFDRLVKSLPAWPWPFTIKPKKGLIDNIEEFK